jgi:hydrogenase-4 component F
MGLVALAFSAVSALGSYGALFQILNHALIKSALFYVAGMLVLEYHTKQILRIRGLIQSSPVAAGLFITAVFAVSGLPPFSMFLSKLLIVQSLFQQDKFFSAVFALLLLVGVFTGLLYYAMRISLGHASVGHSEWKPGLLFLLPVLLSLLAVAGMGISVPSWLDGLLKQAAAIITGGGA